jgi:hypothetical protein
MSHVVCTCPRDNLCHDCLGRSVTWLSGVAAARGHHWASSVAERRPDLLARPWPALDGRAAEIAASKVVDLGGDPRLFAQLLARLDQEARRRWEHLRSER